MLEYGYEISTYSDRTNPSIVQTNVIYNNFEEKYYTPSETYLLMVEKIDKKRKRDVII